MTAGARKTALRIGVAAGICVGLVLIALALIDWNWLRPALSRAITARTGREATIRGDLRVHLFSWNPSVEINGLTLKNPSWAARPAMFSADRITVSVRAARLLRGQVVLPLVSLIRPVMALERDQQGRASWELGTEAGKPNGNTQPAKVPTILSLVIQDGSLHVLDQIRKLRFEGSVAAAERGGDSDTARLTIRAKGTLNSKPFSLSVDGGALQDLTPAKPYTFTAKVTAADIKLDTKATIEKPFDLSRLEVAFVVEGRDLADLFYLTGLALPNTPPYRLVAVVKAAGTEYTIDDLQGRLGSSDLSGRLVVDAGGEIPKMTAHLISKTLNIADLAPSLGAPAVSKDDSLAAVPALSNGVSAAAAPAGNAPPAHGGSGAGLKRDDKLFPDAALQVGRVRGMDADVYYAADSVITPRLPIKKVGLHIVLDGGVLRIDPLSFVLDQGTFAGTVLIDAREDTPDSRIDMRIEDVDLSEFKSAAAKQAPLQGSLQGRVQLSGTGDSLHNFASSANGAISIIIPQGHIEASIAELTGIDLTKGLGLLVAKNDKQTAIRCSVMDFQAQNGVLRTRTFFIDTSDVLINGSGDANLQTEKLDFELKGDPKSLRFTRLRSPITLHGTFAHPTVGLDVKKLAGQAGAAAALGSLLTPVAAVIAFIDPGMGKNKDCAAALQQTTERVSVPVGTASN